MFERVLSHARLFDAMLQHAGVQPGEAVRAGRGTAWQQARTLCLGCPDARRCQDWLATADAQAPPPDFCRSARFFGHRASADCRTLDLVLSPEPVEGAKDGPRTPSRASTKLSTGLEQARRFDLEDADH
jgi:hypothetical protein